MISVVIPAHNEATNLANLLPHIKGLKQYENTEIIVVLSKDTQDKSIQVCNRYGVHWYQSSVTGRAAQLNLGALHAKGKYLAFLHADVWPPSSFFTDIKETLEGTSEAGFFSYQFNKNSFLLNINSKFTKKDGIFTGGGDQCLFIRASVFKKLHGFDEKQVIMEDFEFFRRMKQQKIRYTIIPNNLMVSARKYETNSYLKVNLSNLLLVVLFKIGYPAVKLKRLHSKLISTPYAARK
ncbi:TIGR04283 family arsenosugar biosynthesis glycosyltransferase [Croceivirga sp. JEA036]|uniref:TIGR04283 family arsenosugar biosynthesis glycosyltransferase n=1 Tax=Croceivirga sp. JEA036 TaxID=2721162 RepID=UPI0014386DFB|nr:TIGR04283 family arsenosugar biosynthesis glycosyltransferase [Croceivirga sp. JEA036]NJB37747.1 glycosyltransferase family 2 protein [Croceivirga sp. JEA036]